MPEALQGPVYLMAKSAGLNPPNSETQSPTPAGLKDHPSTHALEIIQKGKTPPEIEAAAQAEWRT